jgi:hypothetical protein
MGHYVTEKLGKLNNEFHNFYPEGRYHMEDLCIHGKIILAWILGK